MPWSQVQLINFETRKHIRTPKRRKRTRKVDPENCMPAEIEWQSNRIKWKEKHWFQIHLCTCVTAYVHVQWHTSSEIRFSKSVIFASYIAKCLISYRVHGAHTLLIDVISYSNNDTALSLSLALKTRVLQFQVYMRLSLAAHFYRWAHWSTRILFVIDVFVCCVCMYRSSCFQTIHQICTVDERNERKEKRRERNEKTETWRMKRETSSVKWTKWQ